MWPNGLARDYHRRKVLEMETIRKLFGERPAIREILLTALAVLFGIEMIRYFVSGMTWILGDRFAIGAFQLGGIAIIIFGMAFLASPLKRIFGSCRSLVITAAGLAAMRLLVQIQYGEPIFNMAATAIGIAFFGMLLTICLDNARLRGRAALSLLAIGLLLGFLLDTALSGLFGSYDYIYQGGIIPLITAIVLVSAELLLLLGYNPAAANEKPANVGTLPWLAIGLFFFLEMVVFSNIARLAALTGWVLPAAFATILIGQVIGLFLAAWFLSSEKVPLRTVALLSSLLLVITAVFSDSGSAVVTAAMTLIGQLSIGLLMAGIMNAIGGNIPSRTYKTSTVVNGFAMIIFVIFVLAYYAVYQISLPYSNTALEIVAAALLVLCVIASFRSYSGLPKTRVNLYMAPVISLALLVAPMVSFIGWRDTEAIEADSDNITVMTYNLHNGFNTKGELDLEALADVIEESGADIVALQEISRGWLISGGVDMLSWLSQRLDMPYVSGPTAGPLWGNAILSRYEITGYSNHELPSDGLCIERGFTVATIDVGDTELQIIATHLHHVEEDSEVRQAQVSVILEYWDNVPNTIILGDLNAWPDSPEMEMLYQVGLTDTLADQPEVLTFSSADLYERIDYIWLSPDIQLLECYVPFSQASDHLAVVAVIKR
jgi:endonuclease/exonuclease/phosphatase family metal-dependent hydrolase